MKIRQINPADREAIFSIQSLELGSLQWTQQGIADLLNLKTSLGFVVMDESEEIIGFILAQIVMDQADILSFAIKKAHQRKGMGLMLWKTMEIALSDRGVNQVFIEVAITNMNALNFYKKRDFIKKGYRENYYINDMGEKITGIIMSKII